MPIRRKLTTSSAWAIRKKSFTERWYACSNRRREKKRGRERERKRELQMSEIWLLECERRTEQETVYENEKNR